MRRKRNQYSRTINTEGYIKKYFGSEINTILVPTNKNLRNCGIPYVHHEEAERILSDFLVADKEKDKSIVFTGLTGSGKSTIVRHIFEIEDNANKCKHTGKTIIIPIDFNRSHISAETAIICGLRAAIHDICKNYKIKSPDIDNEEFYEYIKTVRDDLLYLDGKMKDTTPFSNRLEVFLDKMPLAYASCQLQYVLDSKQCDIELVLLVVDNIEAFAGHGKDRNKYIEPVIEAFRLSECIGQRLRDSKWRFNMVIACRHHVWRILKGEVDDNALGIALLQSYLTTEAPYDLANPVSLNAIVRERDNVISRKQTTQKWKTSIDVVNTVLERMDGTIGDFVLQMHLKDIRKSMTSMQNLILHNGLQNKTDDELISGGAFRIDSPDQFDLSRVNLIKTFGLSNQTHFSNGGIIPNLLYNTSEEGIELYALLATKYFLKKCGFKEPAWDNSVSVRQFYNDVGYIFSFDEKQIEKFFREPVYYLIKRRILLRSADQEQDEVPGMSIKEIKEIEKVYISGAAVRLWDELKKSSALFQLFIDDIFIDEELSFFEKDGNDIEHCFTYLKYLFKVEQKIFNMAANMGTEKKSMYICCFGEEPVCKHLALGLIASINAIRQSPASARNEKAKKTYKELVCFYESIKNWG